MSLGLSAYAAHLFFSERIPVEEDALINMFGDDYKKYRERVPTRIPFIK